MTHSAASKHSQIDSVEDDSVAVRAIDLPELNDEPVASGRNPSVGIVSDVRIELDIRLGAAVMSIDRLMSLERGSVIELDKQLGDSVDVLLNDRLVGRGEIVAVGDHFGIRMTELSHGVSGSL
jgi:flagellar motor switch protein FliN